MVRQRVRIRFCKQGDLRLIGHRDLVRLLERLFRRAGLSLAMSEGFHPKPRMSFPSALALGTEGLDEVMELELAETLGEDEVAGRLASHTLPGLEFRSVQIVPPGRGKAQLQRATYRVPVPPGRRAETTDQLKRLLAESSHPIQRPNRRAAIDLRQSLEELTLRDGVLEIRLRAGRQATASVRDVLAALGLADLETEGVYPTRTRVEVRP